MPTILPKAALAKAGRSAYVSAMRPDLLNPVFAETASLKGVGPGLARPLEKLGLNRIRDLAYHLPDRFVAPLIHKVVSRISA